MYFEFVDDEAASLKTSVNHQLQLKQSDKAFDEDIKDKATYL
jgi:hypothetical protein